MKKLSNTDAELKKSATYKKRVYYNYYKEKATPPGNFE